MSDIPASLYRKGRATQVNIEALQELIAERDAAMEAGVIILARVSGVADATLDRPCFKY